ncbi:isoprenylcysteine carboxylmethyltransferase family protein [Ktedonosporobacter rubrisoli]|uniref:Isoprenylcysteine carboxylmethyltransferase family protein n=1 Tax=Ktedonosporobacter rubrisoli TaxID=2509675 RepID=A0A4P6JV95_KTERU|nr:isoprenylcysteine carboxylmethyltransferase family protein [Ktedonosporobacter rubrisoli]QBD78876.1 isoprenylcysteine carboxylmethyltransferase family protein [Ktedonosporobacter rubrisoli]
MTLLLKAIVSIIISFLLLALALFLPAGTLLWPAGWIFLILLFGFTLLNIGMLFTSSPGLLQERLSLSQPNQKTWDRVFTPLFYLLCLAWTILMPLDAVRFHWSYVPLFLQIIGAIALIGSFPLMLLTFRENTFLSPAVRIQEERGHTVISTGPYHYVRHPLYAGALLLFLGTPLLLGSWYGELFALILIAGMAARAILEERVLCEELPGYKAYMAQVKYRFIPYIW